MIKKSVNFIYNVRHICMPNNELMMDTSNTQKKDYFAVQTFILVVLETGFSFLVKNDPVLKVQAQKLFDRQATIHINSYIPFFDLYLHFTPHGVLFDLNPPEDTKIDLSLRTDLISLLKVLFNGNTRAIKAMKSKGDVDVKDLFQDLLLLCTLPKILKSFPHWLKYFSSPASEVVTTETRIQPLLDTLEHQRESINHLKLSLKESKYRLKKAQRSTTIFKVLSLFLTIALVASISLFFLNIH